MLDLESESNFTFEGFNPSADLKSRCRKIFCRVEDRSPSSSVKSASLTKTRNGYEGLIRVVSSCGTFYVASSAKEPSLLIDDLYTQFSQQISSWSRSREL